jgi:hypothetical protein
MGHLKKSKWKDSNSNGQPLLIRPLQYCSSVLILWNCDKEVNINFWKVKGQCSVRFNGGADCDAVRTCLVLKHIPNQANKKQYQYLWQIHVSLQCRRFRYQVVYIQDRQCTCKRNIKARSRNHSCRGKAESIIYSECVSVACYPARKAHAPCFHLWPVRLYNIFLHYLINGQIFGGKKYWSYNVCFDFLYNYCQKHVLL